jgi:hypothetical protein
MPIPSLAKHEILMASLHTPFSDASLQPSPADPDFDIKLATPPPPPPPPIPGDVETPRVDYLLQSGGLPNIAPRGFFPPTQLPGQPLPSPSYLPFLRSRQNDALKVFAPFDKILDDYLQVVKKNGSLAVATGYRSVARRLLDRLETVFNRNISSEACGCIMCVGQNSKPAAEKEGGVSWGEVLEYVSGRKDLPLWPPFTISLDAPDLSSVLEAPMQKLDIEVPDEYRDHYIRQSNNTKQVVQAWLASQEEVPSSPPQEVDDETLIFAISTRLDIENRRLFTALLRGLNTLPASTSRTPTPHVKGRSELIVRTGVALTRLYRLTSPPRDAECSLFLLQNPELHEVLATLAAISAHEWEILVSGRFDGFLWSGADGPPDRSQSPLGGKSASRGNTPFSGVTTPGAAGTRRGSNATPAGTGAPVLVDEETEMAVLAELEREIYAGMDALEDAFEALHAKAETVREALRSRGAGLAMSSSARRGPAWGGIAAVAGSDAGAEPSPGLPPRVPSGLWDGVLDNGFDLRSELAPDDSASNVSRNRRRKRTADRRELRTPMTVEEEDEEEHRKK